MRQADTGQWETGASELKDGLRELLRENMEKRIFPTPLSDNLVKSFMGQGKDAHTQLQSQHPLPHSHPPPTWVHLHVAFPLCHSPLCPLFGVSIYGFSPLLVTQSYWIKTISISVLNLGKSYWPSPPNYTCHYTFTRGMKCRNECRFPSFTSAEAQKGISQLFDSTPKCIKQII